MEGFKSVITDSARSLLRSIPERVEYINTFASTNVTRSVSEAEEDFLKFANESVCKHSVPVNDDMVKIVSTTKEVLADAILALATVSRWVNVHIPRIEDGGNFGVAVQEFVLKTISEISKDLNTKLDALNDYHTKRADAVKAVAGEFNTSNSTTTSKKEEGSEKKDSNTVEKKSTMTYKSFHKDSIRAIASVDTKYYFAAQLALQTVADAYLTVGCAAERNFERLENPRGAATGKNPFNMY